jgi:cellulose synthase/poly-beta-1,6-N-acetylglucosamine synthase-like glycosyltransferase
LAGGKINNMFLFELIFWFSLFGVFYAFIGYPALLWLLARFVAKPVEETNDGYFPTVTLIISAFNEEKVVTEKIQNALKLNYPKNKFEIMVVSDASSDRTDELVRKFSTRGVLLVRQEHRQGKTAALNSAVPLAKGEIIVFSDANSMYDENAVHHLVKHFQEPSIGFVTGRTRYVAKHGSLVAESAGIYTKLEVLIKRLESDIGSCVGADGTIFAIRKNLFQPLPNHSINDFVIPLQIVRKGYRGIFEEKAFCIEKPSKDFRGEFNRQVRITSRTLRAIVENMSLLNPVRYPIFTFKLLSHKLTKFSLPFFMILIFITNLFLVTANFFYVFIFLSQLICYALAYLGYRAEKNQRRYRIISMIYSFGFVSLAILMGWFKLLSGETYLTWSPQRK